jgi:2'-hydroxyisoflavone reductase
VRILVLGGTSFAGRAIVEDSLRTGAEVTLFGRGKTGTDLFPDLTRLIGDRDTGDYAALGAGSWDAVVDASGYVPRHVGRRWMRWASGPHGTCSSPATRCTGSTG